MPTWPQLLSYFVNPALVVPGLLLVSVPIIIHLINRMRFRRIEFAAMEFLLQSQRKNRRRVLLEQLLLLLLRIGIVFCLMLLLARLVLRPDQLSLLTGNRAHHVVVVDDSGSMRDRWADTTAFDEALEVVRKLVAEGARHPDTQELTLVFLSNPTEPAVRQQRVNKELLNQIESELENRQCTHQSLSLADGLDMASRILADQVGKIRHLHVISDFRQQDWEQQESLGDTLQALDDQDITINLVRTIAEPHSNLSLTELSGSAQVAAAGVPVRIRIGVKNHGSEVARQVRVSVMVDGQRVPVSVVFEKLDPNEEVFQEKDLAFSAGKHELRVELESDALAADNRRYLAINVVPANPVLIIDGDPSGDEGLYIADALGADPEVTGFEPLIENVDFLGRHPLDAYQCIFLVNVSEIPGNALDPLRNFVASGGGLAWYLGASVNTAHYNSELYADGKGIFPIPLGTAPVDLPDQLGFSRTPDVQFSDHPVFLVFEGQDNSWVDRVLVDRYIPVSEDWELDDGLRRDGVRTIARLRNGQPLFVEKQFQEGGGWTVACTTTAGPAWNNWPLLSPCYVPTQLELERHVARDDRSFDQRTVGESIDLQLDPVQFVERVDITTPDGEPLLMQATAQAPNETANEDQGDGKDQADNGGELDEPRLSLSFGETDTPGVYRVRMYDQDQQPVDRWLAYNSPSSESALDVMTTPDLRARIGEAVRVQIHEPGEMDWLEGKDVGQEIRDFLLVLLILFLVAEQLMAYRLSYHPKPAGAMA